MFSFNYVRIIFICSVSVAWLVSCTPRQGIFSGKKTPHEQYSEKIEKAGLGSSALGVQWLGAAQRGLQQPATIDLPYQEAGYFSAHQPESAGYRFSLRKGEKIQVNIQTVPVSGFLLFTELWQPGSGADMKLLEAADTTGKTLEYEIEEDGFYLLRVQPELLRGVEYNLVLKTAPSLAFPVRAIDKPAVKSHWGAERDAGARRHEGIDIFAKPKTPLVAAAPGVITRVQENNLGGKVVFLRPSGKNYSLYYAHLDSQLVQPGQRVNTGDVVGLMGNTGNARTTPAHLHFGIYTGAGAVDPFPFVNNQRAAPAPVRSSKDLIQQYIRNTRAGNLYTSPSSKSVVLKKVVDGLVWKVAAATGDWFRIVLPDGSQAFLAEDAVSAIPLHTRIIKDSTALLEMAVAGTAAKARIPAGSSVAVIGKQDAFLLVRYKDEQGWIPDLSTK